jgi:hypothetical protein
MRLRGLTLRSSVLAALAGLLVVVLGRLLLEVAGGEVGAWAAAARVAGIGLTAAGALIWLYGFLFWMVHGVGSLASAVGIVVNVFTRSAWRRR